MKKYLIAVWHNLASKKLADIFRFVFSFTIIILCMVKVKQEDTPFIVWFLVGGFYGFLFVFCFLCLSYFGLVVPYIVLDFLQGIANFLVLNKIKHWLENQKNSYNDFVYLHLV